MPIRHLTTLAALLFVAACPAPAPPAAVEATPTADTLASTTLPAADTITVNEPLETAVGIAKALQRFPARQDSILAAFGLSAKEYAELMNRVTQDLKMHAEFKRRTQ